VFQRRPDELQTIVTIPDLRGVRAAIVAGAGMSVLPRYLVENDLASGTLAALHFPVAGPKNTVYLATRTGELERNHQLRSLAATIQQVTSIGK
jgi:DNA-binding transcriptional LysR family regulator